MRSPSSVCNQSAVCGGVSGSYEFILIVRSLLNHGPLTDCRSPAAAAAQFESGRWSTRRRRAQPLLSGSVERTAEYPRRGRHEGSEDDRISNEPNLEVRRVMKSQTESPMKPPRSVGNAISSPTARAGRTEDHGHGSG